MIETRRLKNVVIFIQTMLMKDISSCERREFSLQQTAGSTTEINKPKANNHVSTEGIFSI